MAGKTASSLAGILRWLKDHPEVATIAVTLSALASVGSMIAAELTCLLALIAISRSLKKTQLEIEELKAEKMARESRVRLPKFPN
jgi:hypothetical protein